MTQASLSNGDQFVFLIKENLISTEGPIKTASSFTDELRSRVAVHLKLIPERGAKNDAIKFPELVLDNC